jgi:hypothetical protein
MAKTSLEFELKKIKIFYEVYHHNPQAGAANVYE